MKFRANKVLGTSLVELVGLELREPKDDDFPHEFRERKIAIATSMEKIAIVGLQYLWSPITRHLNIGDRNASHSGFLPWYELRRTQDN